MKQLLYLLLLIPTLSLAQSKTQQTDASFEYKELNPITSSNFTPDYMENYNKGIRAYNQAVALIEKSMDSDDPTAAGTYEQEAKKHFKEALPFLEKAYSMKDKDANVITALAGTYFGLDNFTKQKEMESKLKELEKK